MWEIPHLFWLLEEQQVELILIQRKTVKGIITPPVKYGNAGSVFVQPFAESFLQCLEVLILIIEPLAFAAKTDSIPVFQHTLLLSFNIKFQLTDKLYYNTNVSESK